MEEPNLWQRFNQTLKTLIPIIGLLLPVIRRISVFPTADRRARRAWLVPTRLQPRADAPNTIGWLVSGQEARKNPATPQIRRILHFLENQWDFSQARRFSEHRINDERGGSCLQNWPTSIRNRFTLSVSVKSKDSVSWETFGFPPFSLYQLVKDDGLCCLVRSGSGH